ncbi:hypothetical protein OQA88_42 [Cercophora sp. LCS_1]
MHVISLAVTSLFALGAQASACPFKGSRSPCTGLNVLANHGYLPRSGKNIDLPTLRTAVSLAFNYAPETFDTAFQQAVDFNLTTTGNPLTFHLHDLAKHDFIEFDGSLAHNDFYSGDDNEFDARAWGSVADSLRLYDTSKERYVTVEMAAKARVKRVADAMRVNPTFNASAAQMQGSPGTLALALTTTWDDDAGAVPKGWLRAFFENERIPYFEGYQVPKTPRNGDTIGAMFQKIVAVEVEGGDNGFQVTIYDKEKYIGERSWEWTMLLHWALPTLRIMLPDDVREDLPLAHGNQFHDYGDHPETIPFFNSVTGEYAFGLTSPFRRISRTRMRRVCAKGLDIRWGKIVADLKDEDDGTVTVLLEDGGKETADLVIGADGSSSFVRRWLVGQEEGKSLVSKWAIGSAIVKYRTAEQTAAVIAPSDICSVSTGPDGLVLLAVQNVEDPNDHTTKSFQVVRIWKEEGDGNKCQGSEAIAKMKEKTSLEFFAEPFNSAIQWIPDDSGPVFLRQLQYWPSIPWNNRSGRVTLAGDAAHCMLPNRAQGLNHALADVDLLVAQLLKIKKDGISVQEALVDYEKEVVARGYKAAMDSLDDADAVMTNRDLKESRQAKQGLAQ